MKTSNCTRREVFLPQSLPAESALRKFVVMRRNRKISMNREGNSSRTFVWAESSIRQAILVTLLFPLRCSSFHKAIDSTLYVSIASYLPPISLDVENARNGLTEERYPIELNWKIYGFTADSRHLPLTSKGVIDWTMRRSSNDVQVASQLLSSSKWPRNEQLWTAFRWSRTTLNRTPNELDNLQISTKW